MPVLFISEYLVGLAQASLWVGDKAYFVLYLHFASWEMSGEMGSLYGVLAIDAQVGAPLCLAQLHLTLRSGLCKVPDLLRNAASHCGLQC